MVLKNSLFYNSMNAFLFEEKRKKNYLTTILYYTLSSISCFEFASPTLLQNFQELEILKHNMKNFSFIDVFIFCSFFIQKKKFLMNPFLKKFFKKTNNKLKDFKIKISIFEKLAIKKKIKSYNQLLSDELLKFYKISVEKAFLKYNYPIITKENFLVTSINDNPVKFQNVLKFFFKNKRQWYIFQYKIIRYIYFKNLFLQRFTKKNLGYYYYLLEKFNQKNFLKGKIMKKIRFQKIKEFFKKLEIFFFKKKRSKKISFKTKGVLRFRSLLIHFLLTVNFQQILEDDIFLNRSQKIRNYSSSK